MTTQAEQKQHVVAMLRNHQTAMMVTHDIQGGLVSRPMTTQQPDFDGEVWFFVSSDADVIQEIEANAEVNIAYSDEDSWLSLSGTGAIVTDDAKKKELWYDDLAKWFEGKGPESPDVMLIKVQAQTVRYWDMSQADEKEGGNPMQAAKINY